MSEYEYDLNPVDHIIADAMGEPGRRTFFIQARAGSQTINLVLEKQEVAGLAESILQLLYELEEKYPELPPISTEPFKLEAELPVEETFRIRQLMLGYDGRQDKVWIIAKALVIKPSGEIADPDEENVPAVRMVATREQMRRMGEHAMSVVDKGRPLCPLCQRPIDRNGHFCPRTDGEAMPIIF
ncbi:MAG: DUF3090 domain-containing protein [Caldilineaceae bacterium]|nr:DUF3090 domain-containing protein [Caldilineaceae bacterium]MCB9138281.1 DUF3090 domain-containing protein [Caldilineaceae bacterium]